jgi:hypothetical protein
VISGAIIAALTAEVAHAAVFATLLRTAARPGAIVAVRVDSWTATEHPPLYLVSDRATYAFTAAGKPRQPPFVRLRSIEWGRVQDARATIRFRVPKVKRGAYRFIIFCEPCGLSLIPSNNLLRVR